MRLCVFARVCVSGCIYEYKWVLVNACACVHACVICVFNSVHEILVLVIHLMVKSKLL